jgi:hypothetical protein
MGFEVVSKSALPVTMALESAVYHPSPCRAAKRLLITTEVTREEAESMGRRPCRNCERPKG